MSHTMYDFKPGKPVDVTAEEFEAFDKSADGGSFFSEPGSYELKVTEITPYGPVKSDPTWQNVMVTLSGINGESLREFIKVPTSKITYMSNKGEPTKFMYKLYKEFLIALGVSEVNHENVLGFAPSLFGSGSIVGMTLQATLGYKGAYAQFIEKDDTGLSKYALIHGGTAVTDPVTGAARMFPSRTAVEAEATIMGISDFSPFIAILNWNDCPNPDQIAPKKKKTGTGW